MASTRKTVEMRVLPVDLNDEEWDAKAAELARVVEDEKKQEAAIDLYKENSKSALKALEGHLKETRGNRNALATAVSTHRVDRDVPCDWFYNLADGKAVLVRRDTTQAIESRDLKPEERQLAIGERLLEADFSQIQAWEEQLVAARAAVVEEAEAPPSEPEKSEDEKP